MAQYCRYCNGLAVGDLVYCTVKKKEIRETLAKTTNYCSAYDFTPVDAFGENKEGYKPRHKKTEDEQLDGQMSLEEYFEG